MKTTLLLLALTACATTSYHTQIVERIANKTETPQWSYIEKSTQEENNNLLFGYTTTTENTKRPEICLKVAEESAKANILRYVKDNVTHSGQTSETTSNDLNLESLTTWISMGKLNSINTQDRYWEIIQDNIQGNITFKLRCAVRVSISKTELAKQIKEANQPKNNINEVVRKAQEDKTTEFIKNAN
jgi:hypothetical protein